MSWSAETWSYPVMVADACAERGATPEAATQSGRQAILDDELAHCPGGEQGLIDVQAEALAGWVEGRTSSADLPSWMRLVMDLPSDGSEA